MKWKQKTDPVRLSCSVVGAAEASAVSHILQDDGYLGMGTEVLRFEADLAGFLGVPRQNVIAVNSGTAALHLACETLCPRGTGILIPALTYVAAFQAVTAAGCIPVPCEVLPETGTLDPAGLARHLHASADAARRAEIYTDTAHRPGTNPPAESPAPLTISAIMPMTYAGNPFQLDAITAFARAHGLRVITDAAHAFGSRHRGRLVGSGGDVTCFSFDGIKNITCGEGGALICHDAAACRRLRDARLLGIHGDSEARAAGARTWEPDVTAQGWRYHMSNILAAIGRVQLTRFLPEFAPRRQALVRLYRRQLEGTPHIRLFRADPEDDIVPHIFVIRIQDPENTPAANASPRLSPAPRAEYTQSRPNLRDRVREALRAENIETGIHYRPCHLLSYFGGGRVSLPVTEALYSEILTLPLHPLLTEADILRVCAVLKGALK